MNDTNLPPARRLVALRALPGFAQLPASQLHDVSAQVAETHHPRGALLQCVGASLERAQLVVAGVVACDWGAGRRELVRPFQLVGGMDVFSDELAAFSAIAESPVTIFGIDRAKIEALLADSFGMYMAVVAEVARVLLAHRSAGQRSDAQPGDEAYPPARSDGDGGLIGVIAALLEVPELAQLPVDVLAAVATQARSHRYPAGTTVWESGDAPTTAVLPRRGRLRVVVDDHVVALRPRLWGLEEALAGEVRRDAAVAVDDVEALVIEPRALVDELEDDTTAAMAFLRALARAASVRPK